MLDNLQIDLRKAKEHIQNEFAKLQAWRANPAIVEWVLVSAYGSIGPIKNVAAVSTLDAQTIVIQPWDRSVLKDIEKGITDAGLGLNPSNNGESIMIKIPALTEERRRDLTKIAGKMSEEGKIAVRNIRQDHKKKIDHAKSEKEISDDEAKGYEADLQKAIDAAIKEIDILLKEKEVEIMKV